MAETNQEKEDQVLRRMLRAPHKPHKTPAPEKANESAKGKPHNRASQASPGAGAGWLQLYG